MASINLLIITFLQILIIIFFFNTAYCNSIKFPSTILIFGDSTVDTCNNNYIKTLAIGNYLPYGQDFPGHIPTGRFSNGKLLPDFIASALGIKAEAEAVPPFLDPNLSDDQLLSGVSFASSGSGFDDLTTLAFNAIPVSKQIKLFIDYIRRIKGIVGEGKAKKIISGSLVVISAASALGIKAEAVPPFLDPNLSDDQLLSGVSFASGRSGFDDLNTLASKAITVSKQNKLFRDYIRRIKGIVGEEKAKKMINGSLVVISAGRLEFSVGGYQDFLLDRLQSFVKIRHFQQKTSHLALESESKCTNFCLKSEDCPFSNCSRIVLDIFQTLLDNLSSEL
ncbi:hypothetical protein LWI28_015382 [Acer negundo]|uniref:GDSL esterase/lipase n=1 Tax=Acer negundo TaxID=4023 RepID=A0AAD5NFT7_ACENE|nr:hypothetical protein LWI28_015382 [Acer negundo]